MAIERDCVSCSGNALVLRRVRDLIGIFGFIDLHFLLDMCEEKVPEWEKRFPQLGHPAAVKVFCGKEEKSKSFINIFHICRTHRSEWKTNADFMSWGFFLFLGGHFECTKHTERFLSAVDPQMFLQMMLELERLSALLAFETPQVGRLVVRDHVSL